MKHLLLPSFLLIISTLFYSCMGRYIFPSTLDIPVSASDFANSVVTIYVCNNPSVMEFRNAYKDLYPTGNDFSKALAAETSTWLKSGFPNMTVIEGNPEEMSNLSFAVIDSSKIAQNSSIFNDTLSQYIILVSHAQISNKYTAYGGPSLYMAGTSAKVGFSNFSISEQCRMTMLFDIWSAKDKRRLFRVRAHGSASVFLFMYKTAVQRAMINTVEHFEAFIKDGTVEFAY